MKKINSGDPFFPTIEHGFDTVGCPVVRTEPGIILRTQLAAMAMQGLLANQNTVPNSYDIEYAAKMAVLSADLLISYLNNTTSCNKK